MANKLYIDFPPGTYDITKIFLQADPVTGELEKVNLPGAVTYLSRVSLLSQSGTADPTELILHDEFPDVFTWLRTGVGYYTMNGVNGILDPSKLFIMIGPSGIQYCSFQYTWLTTDQIQIGQNSAFISPTDGLDNLSIEFRLYP